MNVSIEPIKLWVLCGDEPEYISTLSQELYPKLGLAIVARLPFIIDPTVSIMPVKVITFFNNLEFKHIITLTGEIVVPSSRAVNFISIADNFTIQALVNDTTTIIKGFADKAKNLMAESSL